MIPFNMRKKQELEINASSSQYIHRSSIEALFHWTILTKSRHTSPRGSAALQIYTEYFDWSPISPLAQEEIPKIENLLRRLCCFFNHQCASNSELLRRKLATRTLAINAAREVHTINTNIASALLREDRCLEMKHMSRFVATSPIDALSSL